MLRIVSPLAIFLVAFTAAAEQRPGDSAFQAYANLPHEAALRLTRIAACEGAPQPARWHFVIHEAAEENGVRDYVIADGRIAAVNAASQFAEDATAGDVLALNSVRIDSGYVAQMAGQYAAANSVRIASMNYDLHKDATGRPVWKVTCLDSHNLILGWLVIDAAGGKVVAQGGFEFAPAARENIAGEPTAADPGAADAETGAAALPEPIGEPPAPDPALARDREAHTGGFRPAAPSLQPASDDPRPSPNRPRAIEVRRAEPVESSPSHRKFLGDLFQPGHRLFPF